MSPCPVFLLSWTVRTKDCDVRLGRAGVRRQRLAERHLRFPSSGVPTVTTKVRDGSDLNNFWERGYQAHGPSSATKALLCEPGHNLHFCVGLKDFITRHRVMSKGRARERNGGSPGSQLWHTLDRVAADGIKKKRCKKHHVEFGQAVEKFPTHRKVHHIKIHELQM